MKNDVNRCYMCGSEVIWQSDFSFEDYGIEGEGLISNWYCSYCKSDIQIITREDEIE